MSGAGHTHDERGNWVARAFASAIRSTIGERDEEAMLELRERVNALEERSEKVDAHLEEHDSHFERVDTVMEHQAARIRTLRAKVRKLNEHSPYWMIVVAGVVLLFVLLVLRVVL